MKGKKVFVLTINEVSEAFLACRGERGSNQRLH